MAKSLADLTAALFAQLERVGNESLTPEQLEQECKRSDKIVALADSITDIADTQLKAAKLFADHGQAVLPHLPQIGKATQEQGK
jgi:hypothetical protein